MIWLRRAWLIVGACAVCVLLALVGTASGAGVAGYTQVTQSIQVPASSPGDVKAPCPSGDVVLSGGFNVSSTLVTVLASQPDKASPTTTWDLSVFNFTRSGPATVTVTATCISSSIGGYEQPTTSSSVPASSSNSATASCSAGNKVVGGGFSGQSGLVLVTLSEPEVSSNIVNNAWTVSVTSNATSAAPFTVTAICVSGSITGYEEKLNHQSAIPASTTTAIPASCSAGNSVLGGGFLVESTREFIMGSEPTSTSTWTSTINNTESISHVAESVAICATPIPPPTVTGIAPTQGPASGGNPVTITGSGFTGATAVSFGTTPATSFTVRSDTQITVIAPAGTPGTVDVTVTAPGGTSATSAADRYTYLPLPAVSSVSPPAGPPGGGNTVTISGSGFTGATAVRFGSTLASSFTVVSDTQITATAPPGAGTVDVTVTGPGGTSATSAADHYTYTSAPVVSGLNPSFGPPAGGTVVTVSGVGFNGATAVRFGSVAASSFTVVSDTQITATAPPGTGTVDVTVTGPGGTSATSAADRYTYASPGSPVVTNKPPQVQSSSAAGFAGSVNPQGLPTTAHFEYFLDPKYGTVTVHSTPDQAVGSDVSSHPVSASVSGLVPNALYHVRLVAKNSAGTTQGPEQTFMTAKDPPPPPPELGKSFNASLVSGLVLIKLPGAHAPDVGPRAASSTTGPGYIPLTEARQLPIGTKVDARRGTMGLTAALTKRHKTQNGHFGGTIFLVTQTRRGAGVTTLTLLSGAFPGAPTRASCGKGKAPDRAPLAHAASYSQTLHASDRGRFRSSGHYAAATVRGTVWDTTDSCAGTLVVVHRGTVAVLDFVRHKTVILHAGQRYLAKPRGR